MRIDKTTYRAQAQDNRQRFLILHYTECPFREAVGLLTGEHVSAHYVVPTLKTVDPTAPDDTTVYALVPEAQRAWHAGVSAWQDRTHLNDSSIGVEIVHFPTDGVWPAYPEMQIQQVITLCQSILQRYPTITPTCVLGHSDIAVQRKVDPGPKFPWQYLHQQGIGAWYDEGTMQRYYQDFQCNMPTQQQVIECLMAYGYCYDGPPEMLLQAFQLHFRASNHSGVFDSETAAIAYALWEKYALELE